MAPASSSTDEPPTHVVVDCSLTPIEYWSLRDDERYHDFLQSAVDPPVTASVISREEDEDGLITRVAEVTPVKNPIPYSLRSMLGCRNGFTFRITEKWRRDKFDGDHPMTFVTEPPVMRERISVSGSQWVEAHGTGSKLHFMLSIKCRVKGVGHMIGKGIAEGSLASYKQLPTLALEYRTLRRAAADANEAFDRASRLSQGMLDSDDETSADGSKDNNATAAAAEAAASIVDEGRRQRARLRWRMALMGVRFRRNLALAQVEGHRLCTVQIDDPLTEGYGPKKHTSYRITSTILQQQEGLLAAPQQSGDVNGGVRHRYSEFVTLRSQLLTFLPGCDAHLPPLPEKNVNNRFSAEVVESRRQSLEEFLQAALDHPILATADEIATFLKWPNEIRQPLFARAQEAYRTPASRQRIAMERMWSLRRRSNSKTSVGDTAPAAPPEAAAAAMREPGSPHLSRMQSSSSTGFNECALSREASTAYMSAVTSQNVSRANSNLRANSPPSSPTLSSTQSHPPPPMLSGAPPASSPRSSHSMTNAGVLPRISGLDDFEMDDGAVRKHASFSDALAQAMMRAAEEAAETVQGTMRRRASSQRSSRLTEEVEVEVAEEEVMTVPSSSRNGKATTSSVAAAAAAASGGRNGVMAAAEAAAERLEARTEAAARARGVSTPSSPSRNGGAAASSSADGERAVENRLLDKLEDIEARLKAIEALNQRRWLWEAVTSMFGCGGPQR